MAARAVVLPEESAQKHSGNVDQSPHTNNFRKERGGMQGQGSADERQSKPRWVEIEHTRPTERPRDTQGMGQTYLADRPRRPARARSEIAGSDRAVVCGPPLSACARSWAATAHANTKWRCTKIDDNRCTSKVTPLLAEPLGYTVSYRYVSDHLYLGRLPAGRGVRSWRWMISRHGARSPARRAPCRRSRTT